MTAVYTDPEEPGAPLVGDLVTVTQDWPPGHTNGGHPDADISGLVGQITGLASKGASPWGRWYVHLHELDEERVVWGVRHPTPEELAAYHLVRDLT